MQQSKSSVPGRFRSTPNPEAVPALVRHLEISQGFGLRLPNASLTFSSKPAAEVPMHNSRQAVLPFQSTLPCPARFPSGQAWQVVSQKMVAARMASRQPTAMATSAKFVPAPSPAGASLAVAHQAVAHGSKAEQGQTADAPRLASTGRLANTRLRAASFAAKRFRYAVEQVGVGMMFVILLFLTLFS